MGVPVVPFAGAPVIATVGATLFTVSWKIVDDVLVPSFAVIVTNWLWAGPSEVTKDHDQVVPDFVTVPIEADSVTPLGVVSLSDQVPELLAVCPSFTVTLALVVPMEGGQLPVPTAKPPFRFTVPSPGVGLVTMKLREPVLALESMTKVAVSRVGLFIVVVMEIP